MDNNIEYEITPKNQFSIGFRELWQYRELFYFFTWREVKVKYKQAALGILWVVLQPILMMLIFTGIFNQGLDLKLGDLPYPIFAFSGLMIWNIFSTGLSGSANSMVDKADIIKKIYFPRLVIPIAAILAALFDFCFALLVFIGLLIWYQVEVNWFALVYCLPASVFLTFIITTGLGTFLAALNVKYRDFRHILPFFIQLLFFVSPVIYSMRIVESVWLQWIFKLNPLSGAIYLARFPFSDEVMDWSIIIWSSIPTILLFVIGIFTFRKTEAYFADLA